MTRQGGFESQESSDGRFLYYRKVSARGIWKLPVGGNGKEEQVADFDPKSQFRCWGLAPQEIYLAPSGPTPQIDLLLFTGGQLRLAGLPAELTKSRQVLLRASRRAFVPFSGS